MIRSVNFVKSHYRIGAHHKHTQTHIYPTKKSPCAYCPSIPVVVTERACVVRSPPNPHPSKRASPSLSFSSRKCRPPLCEAKAQTNTTSQSKQSAKHPGMRARYAPHATRTHMRTRAHTHTLLLLVDKEGSIKPWTCERALRIFVFLPSECLLGCSSNPSPPLRPNE